MSKISFKNPSDLPLPKGWCVVDHAQVWQMDDRHSGLWYWLENGVPDSMRRGPFRSEAAAFYDCRLTLRPPF